SIIWLLNFISFISLPFPLNAAAFSKDENARSRFVSLPPANTYGPAEFASEPPDNENGQSLSPESEHFVPPQRGQEFRQSGYYRPHRRGCSDHPTLWAVPQPWKPPSPHELSPVGQGFRFPE